MIIILIIILAIVIIGALLWVYIKKNKNNDEILNSYLRSYQMQNLPEYDDLAEYNNLIKDNLSNNLIKDNLSNNNLIKDSHTNYPGSIDDAVNDINKDIMKQENNQSINLTNGHPELMQWENNLTANSKSMASNLTNISAPMPPQLNGPIIPYEEANDNSIDYDEKNSYQLLKRNDPIRPIVGEIHRKSFVDPYLREELDTTAKKEWWGNGEY
jgi:hypothetical protein